MDPTPNTLRTADLQGALSLAADLAVGLPAEHAARACHIGLQIGSELGLRTEEQADLYCAELLMDAGCTAFTSQLASYIMGEEIAARRDLYFHTDVSNPFAVASWMARHLLSAGASTSKRRTRPISRFTEKRGCVRAFAIPVTLPSDLPNGSECHSPCKMRW